MSLCSTSGRLDDAGILETTLSPKPQYQGSGLRTALCSRAKFIFIVQFCVYAKKVLKFQSPHFPGPSGRHFFPLTSLARVYQQPARSVLVSGAGSWKIALGVISAGLNCGWKSCLCPSKKKHDKGG